MYYGPITDVFKETRDRWKVDWWAKQAGRETVYEFDGQRYHTRQCREHILYRTDDRRDEDCTLAVPCLFQHAANVDAPTPCVYPQSVFQEQARGAQSRRFALYDCVALRGVAVLLFAPNGTGTFYDYYRYSGRPSDMSPYGVRQPDGSYKQEAGFPPTGRGYDYGGREAPDKIEFRWNGAAYGLQTPAAVLNCPWETLLPLCEEIVTRQVWPRMADPYVTYAQYPDLPLGFDSGSQEELEHLTRCICHADTALFAAERRQDYYVQYRSTTPSLDNGFYEPVGYLKDRLKGGLGEAGQRLCRLAFAHNTFHGGFWEPSGNDFSTRDVKYHLQAIQINVCVLPPSAHERAESLLALHDWLQDKVTDEERRALLQM